MKHFNLHEAKTHLSRIARLVKRGETVILCDRNRPFAEIRPLTRERSGGSRKRILGIDAGKFELTRDWDSPETNAKIEAMFRDSKIFPGK